MGVCGCGVRQNFESIYKEFFDKIKIRTTSAADWATKIKINFDGKQKKITDTKWDNILKNILFFPDDSELSSIIFKRAITNSEQREGQHLIVLSCLFLCTKNSFEAKKHFKDLASVTFGMKNEFKEENNILYFQKNKLFEIISFYVNLVSLLPVDKLSAFANNKTEFEELLNKTYAEKNQLRYIDEEFMTSQIGEWINLDEFFMSDYAKLVEDGKIRESLARISQEPIKI